MKPPDYRLRLFLSVDLVGSTAFKSGAGSVVDEHQLHPRWVNVTRELYQEFPGIIASRFKSTPLAKSRESENLDSPRLWKTVGDELIFCCRVRDLSHLAACMDAFVDSLSDYGLILEKKKFALDVKGAAWIASFPGRNKAIRVFFRDASVEESKFPDEKYEASVDDAPENFDFLGPEIDAGFRVAQQASADNCAISAELAWLLSHAAHLRMFGTRFEYYGRKVLKGVLSSHPYPVIALDAERNPARREVRDRERILSAKPQVEPIALFDFLSAYMENEEVEIPIIDGCLRSSESISPSYKLFCETWASHVQSDEQAAQREESDETSADQKTRPSDVDTESRRNLVIEHAVRASKQNDLRSRGAIVDAKTIEEAMAAYRKIATPANLAAMIQAQNDVRERAKQILQSAGRTRPKAAPKKKPDNNDS